VKILYVSQLASFDSALYRVLALRREGHEVETVNTLDYTQSNPLLQKLEFRLAFGPGVHRLNRDILAAADRFRPDILWADKALWMQPATLHRLRSKGILSVSYMIDNYFGPRGDPGWRLYAKTARHKRARLPHRGRTQCHQNPDRIRANSALPTAGKLVGKRPRP
jgi:hypothetical protein